MFCTKIFVFAICFPLIYGQYRRKEGVCPPFPNIGECSMTCFADDHCLGLEKCCRTACGGTVCIRPVTNRRPKQMQEKPGECPNPPTGPWVCSSRCSIDSDCRGTTKCCRNRCGAMACVRPRTTIDEIDNNILE